MSTRAEMDRQADQELLDSGVLGPKVLTVAADCSSTEADVLAIAKSVVAEVRRLRWAGYDLRHGQIRCFLLRDDTPVEPGPIGPGEVVGVPYKRRKQKVG